jgi:hypothetical protein
MNSDAERKEQIRVKKAEYDAQEHMKERRRIASSARSKVHKVATTEKRIQEHSIDELMIIARNRCLATNTNWDENRAKILDVLRMLHGPDVV